MSVSVVNKCNNESMDTKLQKFLKKNNCFYIHYAGSGIYDGSSPVPSISCIAIFNEKTEEAYKFDIKDHLNGNSLEQAEKEMLAHFKTLFEKRPDACFIHWNMLADGFGFNAIQARAGELGINIPIPDKEHLFDLSACVEYLAGKKLSIKQIFWFNSLLNDSYLDGKTEAEYFEQRNFEKIGQSVSSKVIALSLVADEIKNGTLKTEKPFAEANDGLTREERRKEALKLAETRDKMINDIIEHNKRLQEADETECEEEQMMFYDSAHPFISLLCSWFAGR